MYKPRWVWKAFALWWLVSLRLPPSCFEDRTRLIPVVYSRTMISSMATFPPLSTLTTLWIGLKPVRVISTI
jgi:hypothetical protein